MTTLEQGFKEQLALKDKEIALLKQEIDRIKIASEEYIFKFNIYPPEDSSSFVTSFSRNQIKDLADKELQKKIEELNKKALELDNSLKQKTEEINLKQNLIKKQDKTISELKEKLSEIADDDPALTKKALSELKNQIMKLSQQNNEKTEEINVLILQCQQMGKKHEMLEMQLRQQDSGIEHLRKILKQKESEGSKKETYIAKLVKELETKKDLLHCAQLKLGQLNKELNTKSKASKLEEEVKLLKGMLNGSIKERKRIVSEINSGKRRLTKARRIIEMQKAFIEEYLNKDDEEQMKRLDNIEKLNAERSIEETEEPSVVQELEEDKKGILPDIKQRYKENPKKGTMHLNQVPSKERSFRDAYQQRIDDYYTNLEEKSLHNNSTNIKAVLSQNFSSFNERNTRADMLKINTSAGMRGYFLVNYCEKENLASDLHGVLANNSADPSNFSYSYDVSNIIRKSIGKKKSSLHSIGQSPLKMVLVKPSQAESQIEKSDERGLQRIIKQNS